MTDSLIELGLAIRKNRKKMRLTIKELANRANVSIGLISKIENYRTVPSLPVLVSIATALRVDLSELVKNVKTRKHSVPIIIRKADRVEAPRENGEGVLYSALIERELNGFHFQSFIVRLEPNAWRDESVTDGDEFILALKGTIELKIGKKRVTLNEGDSVFFDGSTPHKPSNPTKIPAEFLAVYFIKSEK